MRLLFVSPSGARGGAEVVLEALVGPDDTVACLADGPAPSALEARGARVVRLRAGRARGPRTLRAVVRLARLARRHDAVVGWQVKGQLYAGLAAALARRPCLWWDHGIASGSRAHRFVARLPARLVVTSSEAAAAARRTRYPRTPVVAVHPGIEAGRPEAGVRDAVRAEWGIAPEALVVGTVGRLQRWKGQHLLLEAVALCAPAVPGARLVVVGGSPGGFDAGYPRELRRLASRLGIADRVVFAGWRDDVARCLSAFDIFVLPSRDEPFGIVTVEAMAAGLPVVATDGGGTREIVADGVTGLLVPTGDASAMAGAILRLAGDRRRAGSLGRAGRARAEEAFTAERMRAGFAAAVARAAGPAATAGAAEPLVAQEVRS